MHFSSGKTEYPGDDDNDDTDSDSKLASKLKVLYLSCIQANLKLLLNNSEDSACDRDLMLQKFR